MREELATAVKEFFEGMITPDAAKAPMSKDIEDALARLAVFTVKARSGVVRHGHSRELVYVPDAEAPTRLAKQLRQLSDGLAKVRGAVCIGPSDLRTVLRVALDCLTKDRRAVIGLLASNRKALPTKQIAERLRMPYATIARALEDLECHGVMASTKRNERLWVLSDWTRDRLRGYLPEVSVGGV